MPWLRITDPDGGLEMIYLLREPSVKLLGISCTMGCSTTDVCMASIHKLLELTGRTEVPLVRGANAPQELGQPTDAARFIIDAVMNHPGQVEVIATAPLTNIATALMLEPRLPANWKMLHLATGEFWGTLGKWSDGAELSWLTGYRDININVDVPAVRYVLEHAGTNMRIYPNEIMDEAFLTRADRSALSHAATPLATSTTHSGIPPGRTRACKLEDLPWSCSPQQAPNRRHPSRLLPPQTLMFTTAATASHTTYYKFLWKKFHGLAKKNAIFTKHCNTGDYGWFALTGQRSCPVGTDCSWRRLVSA